MFTKEIVDFLIAHKEELVENTAASIYDQKLEGYSNFERPQLTTILNRIYDIIFSYFSTNDAEEYRNAVVSAVENRMAQGFNGDEIIGLSAIISNVTQTLFNRERPNSENDADRQRLARRFEGTMTLTQTTALATRLKLKSNNH